MLWFFLAKGLRKSVWGKVYMILLMPHETFFKKLTMPSISN
jgi:hypothetical protein